MARNFSQSYEICSISSFWWSQKLSQRADKKLFFRIFKKLAFLKKLIWDGFLCPFSNKHVKSIWPQAKFEGFASLKFKTWWFLNKISYFIQRFLCARSSWAQIERSKVGSHLNQQTIQKKLTLKTFVRRIFYFFTVLNDFNLHKSSLEIPCEDSRNYFFYMIDQN